MSDAVPPTNESAVRESRPSRKSRWWKWPAIVGGGLVLLPLAAFALWATIALSFTYSKGDRAGYLTKFSQKGWVCKTWEGELQMVSMPGTSPEIWRFTVRDDSIAAELFIAGQGVDLGVTDFWGRSAEDFARSNGNTRLAELITRNRPAAR
jgi:hypothetical protein